MLGLGIWLALTLWVRGALPRGTQAVPRNDDMPIKVMLKKRGDEHGED